MANDKVTKEYTVKVTGKGLKEVSGSLDKLNRQGEKVTTTSKGLNKSSSLLEKNYKGVSVSTNNTTKAFSKMQQGMGSLVGVYATTAASVFALSAVFLSLKGAADFEILIESAKQYETQTGIAISNTAKEVKKLTLGMVSLEEATRNVIFTTAAGFDTTAIKEIAKVARNASIALGRDLGDSLDRLVRGVTKAEPELLDELGIILRLEPATRKYAAQIGKTASSLTTFEKQQAILNEVLEQGNKKFRDLSTTIDVNPYTKLAATFDEVAKAGLSLINVVLKPIISFFADNTAALTAAVVLLSTSILKKAIPSLSGLGTILDNKVTSSLIKASVATSNFKRNQENLSNSLKTIFSKNIALFSSLDNSLNKLGKNSGITLTKTLNKAISNIGKDPKAYVTIQRSLAAGLKRLKFGAKAFGIDPSVNKKASDLVIRDLERVLNKTKDANKLIREGFLKTGVVAEGVFSRIKLAGIATASAISNGFISMFATLSSGALLGFSAGLRGGLSGIKKEISSVLKSTGKLAQGLKLSGGRIQEAGSSALTTAKSIKILGLSMGGFLGTILKAVPILGQLFIGYEILKTVLDPIGKALGITTKETEALSASMEASADTISGVSESTKFYEKTLSLLPNTIENNIKQLDNQINRLNELNVSLTDLGKKSDDLDSLGNSLSRFSAAIGFGGLSNFRDSLTDFSSILRKQGLSSEIDDLISKFGDISKQSAFTATQFRAAMSDLVSSTTKAKIGLRELNKEDISLFDRLGKSLNGLISDLPKLSQATIALVSLQAALSKLGKTNLSALPDILASIKEFPGVFLGISSKELVLLDSARASLRAYDLALKAIRDTAATTENEQLTGQRNLLALLNDTSASRTEAGRKLIDLTKRNIVQLEKEQDIARKSAEETFKSSVPKSLKDSLALRVKIAKSLQDSIDNSLSLTKEQDKLNTALDAANKLAKDTNKSYKDRASGLQATIPLFDSIAKKQTQGLNRILQTIAVDKKRLKDSKTEGKELIELLLQEERVRTAIRQLEGKSGEERKRILNEINTLLDAENSKYIQATESIRAGNILLNEKLNIISSGGTYTEAELAAKIKGINLDVIAGKVTSENAANKIAALNAEKSIQDKLTSATKARTIITESETLNKTETQTIRSSADTKIDTLVTASTNIDDSLSKESRVAQYKAISDAIIAIEQDTQSKIQAVQDKADEERKQKVLSVMSSIGSLLGSAAQAYARQSANAVTASNKAFKAEAKSIRAALKDGTISKTAANKKLIKLEADRVKAAEKAGKKQFEMNKKLQKGQVIINTASAIMRAWSDLGPIAGSFAAAAIAATGALQLQAINSSSFNSGTPINTNVSNPVQQQQEQPTGAGNTTIRVLGRKGVVYIQDTMDELLDNIEEAVQRGDRILISRDSRNGIELAGDLA